MATETLYATSLTSGSVATPANALGAPNGVFTTDTGGTNWTARFAIGNPVAKQANGTMTVRLRVRKETGQSGTPVVNSITLYEGGVSKGAIGTGSWNVTATGAGADITATFAASLIGNPDNVEFEVVTTGQGGNPSTRTSVQLDAVTLTGDFTAPTPKSGTFAAAHTWTATFTGSSGGGGQIRVGLVVATPPPGTPDPDDQRLYTLLTGAGHAVTYLDDDAALPTTGYDVFVFAQSIGSSATALTNIPASAIPVIYLDTHWGTSILRFSSANATGTATTQATITAAGTTHPITSGRPNPMTIYSGSQTAYRNGGTLASGVTSLAEVGGFSALAVAEAGGTDSAGGTFPSRRVGIPWGAGSGRVATAWTADADAVLLDSVLYAADVQQGSGNGEGTFTAAHTWTASFVGDNGEVSPLPGSIAGVEPEAAGGFRGPYIDALGGLYVVTEQDLATGNHPQILKSTDGGSTWSVMDQGNNPGGIVYNGSYNDMESAWLAHDPGGDALWVTYMKSQSRWWGVRFRTDTDTWDASTFATSSGQDSIATEASESGIAAVVLPDGTVRAFIRADTRLLYRTRTRTTDWDTGATYIADAGINISRPAPVARPDGTVDLFYRDQTNGQVRHRTISAAGAVGASQRVDTGGAGAGTPYENNVVPPVFYSSGGTPVAVVAFVNASDRLRVVEVRGGTPGSEQEVSTATVGINALDSQGPTAALTVHGTTLYALWVTSTGGLHYASRPDGGAWSAPTALTATASPGWLYARVLVKPNGDEVLGYTYNVAPLDDDSNIEYDELLLAAGSTDSEGTFTAGHAWTADFAGTRPSQGGFAADSTWSASFAGMAPTVEDNEGTFTAGHAWDATFEGGRPSEGSFGATHVWGAAFAGARASEGDFTATHTWDAAFTGVAPTVAAAEGTFTAGHTWDAAFEGSRPSEGSFSAAIVWDASAEGEREPVGEFDAATTWTANFTGESPAVDVSDGGFTAGHTWTADFTGEAPVVPPSEGTFEAAHTWTANFTGHSPSVDDQTGVFTAGHVWSALFEGSRASEGAFVAEIGWDATFGGSRPSEGTFEASVDWTAAFAGVMPAVDGRSGTFAAGHAWTAAFEGQRDSLGEAATASSVWTATFEGSRPSEGAFAAGIEWDASFTGVAPTLAAAAGTFAAGHAWTADFEGSRPSEGTFTAAHVWTAFVTSAISPQVKRPGATLAATLTDATLRRNKVGVSAVTLYGAHLEG